MILHNQFSEIGDSAIVKMGEPVVGITSLYGYLDETYGETEERYFVREFKYSNDGVVYSEWKELNSYELQALEIVNNRIFDIQVRYTRQGMDSSGLLKFIGITIQAKYIEIVNPPSYQSSFLSQFFDFNDPKVLKWAINVLKKVYEPGIVPSFIERTDDFVVFWGIVTHWFAIQVHYARQYENLGSNSTLLREYLNQRGLITNSGLTVDQMANMLERIFEIFRKRGSLTGVMGLDSEFRKILEFVIGNEFIFCNSEKQKISWFMNQSSPVYRGNRLLTNSVKGYDFFDVTDISKYPVTGGVSLSSDDDDGGSYLIVELDSVEQRGLSEVGNIDKCILVDSRLDYEIFVKFEIPSGSTVDGFLFGVRGYNNFEDPMQEVDIVSVSGDGDEFISAGDNVVLGEMEYALRGCLYGYNQEGIVGNYSKLSVYKGRNLIMPIATKSIIPYLLFTGSGEVWVKSVQVRPMMTKFSLGFVGLNSLALFWGQNNSGSLSELELTRRVDTYLIPAETKFIPIWADKQVDEAVIPMSVLAITVVHISCYALDNGVVTVSVGGGVPPYEYSIDGGITYQSVNSFENLSSGNYSVVIRDSVGSVLISRSVEVTRPPVISISSVQVNDISVYGANDGSIVIQASGGTSPLFYKIIKEGGAEYPYQLSNVFSALGEGNYTVRVTDYNSCPYSEITGLTIVEPEQANDLEIMSIEVSHVTSYGGSDGTITVVVIGGTEPYEYALSVPRGAEMIWQSSNVLTGISAGDYRVVARDSGGTTVTSQVVAINQPSNTINIGFRLYWEDTGTDCTGNGACGLGNISLYGTIRLLNSSNTVVATRSVNIPVGSAQGVSYMFSSLPAGQYKVDFNQVTMVCQLTGDPMVTCRHEWGDSVSMGSTGSVTGLYSVDVTLYGKVVSHI